MVEEMSSFLKSIACLKCICCRICPQQIYKKKHNKLSIMHYTILDCYTDEASGLGVPPYLGTYPRYIYGKLMTEKHKVTYLTIDDLRLWKQLKGIKKETSEKEKTNIFVHNLTKNDAQKTLNDTDKLIIILGVHVPGKYLTAFPGTLKEVTHLLKDINCEKILTGPAVMGTQMEGGKFAEKVRYGFWIEDYNLNFPELAEIAAAGAGILQQIPDRRIIEIETSRGCKVGQCSFCTEPIKNRFVNRKMEDVLKEISACYNEGARFFRLGKQADFYAIDRPIKLLTGIRKKCPEIKVLHIDNVNPNSVIADEMKGAEITKAIVKYCTSGNIAAFGIESFDVEVVRANRMNTSPSTAIKAIEIINKYGSERGENGMPKFLPGVNLIFGLLAENRETHQKNMDALQIILNTGLLLRRINLRQVSILPGTYIEEHGGNKFLRKNKKYYWKWRDEIRQKIDFSMLQRIVPIGTILKEVYAEIYDGKTTFCRQMGTYPLIVGVKGRLPLGQKINIKVTGHMLRSIIGEVVYD